MPIVTRSMARTAQSDRLKAALEEAAQKEGNRLKAALEEAKENAVANKRTGTVEFYNYLVENGFLITVTISNFIKNKKIHFNHKNKSVNIVLYFKNIFLLFGGPRYNASRFHFLERGWEIFFFYFEFYFKNVPR